MSRYSYPLQKKEKTLIISTRLPLTRPFAEVTINRSPGPRTALAAVLLVLLFPAVQAQGIDSPGLFHCPPDLSSDPFRWAITVPFAKIPQDIIEEASYIRAPMFVFSARYGLPEDFVLNGSISTQILNNQLALGGGYIRRFDRLHLEAGYSLAYWFGFLEVYGFDNSANGWINYPYFTAGYDFGVLALSLRGELNIATSIETFAGETEVSSTTNFFNGYSLTLLMEQPLYRQKFITLGVRFNRLKFFWPTWPLFPTFNKFYAIPELIVGFRL